jgi:hypothetical protein
MNILLDNFKLKMFCVLLSIASTFVSVSLHATDYYVKVNGSGTRAGNNWANAMDSRSFARKLLTAVHGDIFHLAAGSYVPYFDVSKNEPGNARTKTFSIPDGVSIQGGYDAGGRPISDIDKAISAVQLNGAFRTNSLQDNAYHVVTISGNANNASNPMLHKLTVTNGYANGGGNNSRGAGIFIGTNVGAKKTVEFSYIRVLKNQSNDDGCGIYIDSRSSVLINNSQITGNTRIAPYNIWGGGISIVRSQLTISNSRIADNVAGHGGAMHILAGKLTSNNCVYDNNSSDTHGGAIDMYERSEATFDSDVFTRNLSGEGGGIHNESRSNISLKGCILKENSATEGAGFYNSGDCTAEIYRCVFERNKARQRGGGIDNRGRMSITQSRITENAVSEDDANGGGINQRGVFVMKQSEVSYNTAKNGAGIYTENNITKIENTTISHNTATVGGGGIYHQFDKCELAFVTIAGNTAPKGKGSGIMENSRPSILNSIISGNANSDDLAGATLFEAGDGNSAHNIIGSMYYSKGNRMGTNVGFDSKLHLGALAFNRGAFTRTHALVWTQSSINNPAVGKATFDANHKHDQSGIVRSTRYPSLGAWEEPFFKAYRDDIQIDGEYKSVDILSNDSYPENCTPTVTILTPSRPMASKILYTHPYLTYIPKSNVKGFDTVRYRIQCPGGYEDSSYVVVEIGTHYNRPQNIKDEVICMEDMPAVKFNIQQKIFNDSIRVDGFSAPLVGDLNGDGKPEIVGLGVLKENGDNITWLEAVGKSIVIYDGQAGNVLLNFDLNTLGKNKLSDGFGYGTGFGFQLRYDPRHNSYSHLAIADLDSDGIGEIVVAETGSGKVYALKPVLGNARKIIDLQKSWETGVLHKAPYKVGAYEDGDVKKFGAPVPYISDLNGDGTPEVIVYNKIYNGRTGILELELETLHRFNDPQTNQNSYKLCKQQYAYVGRLPSAHSDDDCMPVMAINDIDGDGIMEIIAGSKIYKPNIVNTIDSSNNKYTVIHGPESAIINHTKCYLTDGFTVVADIDGDDVSDVIVVKAHNDRTHFVIYVWDPRKTGNESLKAVLSVQQNADQGYFSVPFVGDINGRSDGQYGQKLPEICMTIAKLENPSDYPVSNHPMSKIPDYTDGKFRGNDNSEQTFRGHVVAFTYDAGETDITKRLKLSWLMKHSDISHQTGIAMFDFDADGINELVYRDELSLRVISPAHKVILPEENDLFDFINLKVDHQSNPDVIRFKETGIFSYTGFENPVIADVNGDGSADIITFAMKANGRTENSSGHLFVYEAKDESWAPARPVWNQGIYYPLQINDDLTVPRHPQSTLTKYYSKLPAQQQERIIQPFNGNWIQQPIVRTNNYAPILMTSDPSIRLEGIKMISSTKSETKIRITVNNRGEASANASMPVTFYHTEIDSKNIIMTAPIRRDIFPNESATEEYTLKGNFHEKVIYVRLVDNGISFPAPGYTDCDPTNNVAYTARVIATDDYFSLPTSSISYLDVCANDLFDKQITPQIEITESAHYGLVLVSAGAQISYTPNQGFQGVDTIRYRIRCTSNNITVSSEATAYILTLEPGAQEYMACPGANIRINLASAKEITYSWYNDEKAGNTLPNGKNTNTYMHVKSNKDEALWVQPVVSTFKNNLFPRLKISLHVAAGCNSDKLSDCMTDGTLLFKEDFGGNSFADVNVVPDKNGGIAQVKNYVYSSKYIDNSYTVRKLSGGGKGWVNNIDDHTYPNDTSKGYMLQFNTTKNDGQFYECQLNDLCEGLTLNISAWAASVSATASQYKSGFIFIVEDADGNVLAKHYTEPLENDKPVWKNYGFAFTTPHITGSLIIKIVNNSAGNGSKSFVLDDVEIRLCTPKIQIADIDGDTTVCPSQSFALHGSYPDAGNPFGKDIAYRWEFRHIDSANWQTLLEQDTTVPLNATWSVSDIGRSNNGYYRLRAGKRKYAGSMMCWASSDSVRVLVVEVFRFPDIRIQLSPLPKRVINLTGYLDSVGSANIRWERVTLNSPAISAGTDMTTGSVNSWNFAYPGTYTYKYVVSSQCGSSEAKTYIRTLKDRTFHAPDTVLICKKQKLSESLNLNQILAMELGGTWIYDATVNPDTTTADNVVEMSPPSKYAGALIFNAAKAWDTAPAAYAKPYRGHNDAKIFKFVYLPPAKSVFTAKKKLVIVVTGG